MRAPLHSYLQSYVLSRRYLQFFTFRFERCLIRTPLACLLTAPRVRHCRALQGGLLAQRVEPALLDTGRIKDYRLCFDARLYVTKATLRLRLRTRLLLSCALSPSLVTHAVPFMPYLVELGAFGANSAHSLQYWVPACSGLSFLYSAGVSNLQPHQIKWHAWQSLYSWSAACWAWYAADLHTERGCGFTPVSTGPLRGVGPASRLFHSVALDSGVSYDELFLNADGYDFVGGGMHSVVAQLAEDGFLCVKAGPVAQAYLQDGSVFHSTPLVFSGGSWALQAGLYMQAGEQVARLAWVSGPVFFQRLVCLEAANFI